MNPSILLHWNYHQPYVRDVTFRLYENNELIIDNIGELYLNLLMDGKEFGNYTYNVTAVLQGKESVKSNDFVVQYQKPNSPHLFGFEFYMRPPTYSYTPVYMLESKFLT